jgi:hypothetical protein
MTTFSKSIISDGAEYRWSTDYCHWDNNQTMAEFLGVLDDSICVVVEDGTYAEIISDSRKYEVHAAGDGDSYNHVIRFVEIEKGPQK